jgi:hypothetical protein
MEDKQLIGPNVINLPLGINESERLTRALMDAISAFYRSPGNVDEQGRTVASPKHALRAVAATAGTIIYSAPAHQREGILAEFMADVAKHGDVAS